LLAACMLDAGTIGAQVPAAVPAATIDTAKHLQVLFTLKDGALAVGVVAGTIALFPVDRSLAVRLQNENSAPGGKTLNTWANGFDYLAIPGVFVAAPALYLVGRFGH